jgi:hypothetical protein
MPVPSSEPRPSVALPTISRIVAMFMATVVYSEWVHLMWPTSWATAKNCSSSPSSSMRPDVMTTKGRVWP